MAKNDPSDKLKLQHQTGPELSSSQPAHDVAAAVAEQARDTLTAVKEKGQEALNSAAMLPKRASDAAACQMKHAAEQLRERAPHEGPLGTAAHSVADGLDTGAAYLREHDFRAIAKDLAGVVRSHPIPAVLAGIGVGFLLGRTLRS